ncbi:23S rRNA (pseudouridine1915-N3)-methyltransferase [Pseudobacter ginsenosidimutans]|uniref:Ribosomal RNA large subunit methyltransferase H n=2 Tax=Pseudobacter ginsenosidimutans TaxID=661488 RepID=A0A4Q7MZG7_9BACT|nr:23S rRNA (pseudouridine1915-N3)-methyltransferase [Pseudobacter ginsenosidimutans]
MAILKLYSQIAKKIIIANNVKGECCSPVQFFSNYFYSMKFQFWTIGKKHEPYVLQGIEDFTNRISNYYPVQWNIIPGPRNAATLSESDLKKKEGEIILNMLQKDDYLVALDERGKQFSSEKLAQFIETRAADRVKNLVFLIGGAYGIDEAVMKRSNYQWSLSQLVFPHQLVRLILAEQIYRACTITRNEKYHHK